ncbi:MAG: prepilin-type N-terminal cleavage/methylation domain-containing protein [Planctomycetes bacterium]|nr:prepilin-type N-terminal cleavage/methylation domain-containing protein [Planctomycetota bacterium]MCH7601302.1 prepilin-type N-terminal cleavage/methylation domain-containing protein [Planctomycetota bacterium]
MNRSHHINSDRHYRPENVRRGFNLVELLIALSISATLLTATMVALDASFKAYQKTVHISATHTVARLTMHRMLAMIRTGDEFGPFPLIPTISVVESDFIEFVRPDGTGMSIEWVETPIANRPIGEALYIILFDNNGIETNAYLLLEGVIAQTDAGGQPVSPFTLEYELGRRLHRVTIDLTVIPDMNASLELEGDNPSQIRLVASAMPRSSAYR